MRMTMLMMVRISLFGLLGCRQEDKTWLEFHFDQCYFCE